MTANPFLLGLLCGGVLLLPAAFAVEPEAPVDPPASMEFLRTISVQRMTADVAQLSDAQYNGRQTGTIEDARSAEFIASRFASLGLHPADHGHDLPLPPVLDKWSMPSPTKTRRILPFARLELQIGGRRHAAQVGTEYLPILDSPSVHLGAQVVFVGYGIFDPEADFDEYAGVDVRDCVVLFLRGKPERYPRAVTQAEKERTAREKGAAAFLAATGPILTAYESRRGVSGRPSALYLQSPDQHPLPGAWISTELAERIVSPPESGGRPSLRAVQEELNRMGRRSSVTQARAELAWESVESEGTLHNVVGILPGGGQTASQAVVVGAHRDHFGRQAGLLFPGADDNGSGTAVLLETARVLAQSGSRPRRSIVFASFSGEEQGLLGSRAYVDKPAHPLNATAGMINVDHAGSGNGRLTIGVAGIPNTMAVQAAEQAGLSDKIDLFGFFPGGDHVPFKEAGVPTVTVVSGGVHPNFHQPSDTADHVRPDILEAAARYVAALAWRWANEP